MDYTKLFISPSFTTAIAGIIVTLALFIWWLIRKRRHRVWLPVLRVIDLSSNKLPKMRINPPPLISFLCFLLLALTLLFFTTKPQEKIFKNKKPNQNRVHIFLDLSTSLQGVTTTDNYIAKVERLLASFVNIEKITFSSSHNLDIHQDLTPENLRILIRKLGFHRPGLKLGQAIRKQLKILENIDQLIIVSDNDHNSWSDFNWKRLSNQLEVIYYPIAAGSKVNDQQNIYIDGATQLNTPSDRIVSFDIKLAKSGIHDKNEGILKVKYLDKIIKELNWNFPHNKTHLTIRVQWPISELPEIDPTNKVLVWEIEPNGKDAITSDNRFLSKFELANQDVLMVAQPLGEMFIDDYTYHFEASLKVLGFNVKRLDRLRKDNPIIDLSKHRFIVLFGGSRIGIDSFCPDFHNIEAPPPNKDQNSNLAIKNETPLVWLLPYDLGADFRELCGCYVKLTEAASQAGQDFCEDIVNAINYRDLLASLGANQIGGELGQSAGAIAWHKKNLKLGYDILAFNIPLKPLKSLGLNYAKLPLIIRSLLVWQGKIGAKNLQKTDIWPRIEEISSLYNIKQDNKLLQKIGLSNIPMGESLLTATLAQNLPPLYQKEVKETQKTLVKKDNVNPLPWLRFCVFCVIIISGFEGIVRIIGFVLRIARNKANALLILLSLVTLNLSKRAEANIQLNLVGYQKSGPVALRAITREVVSRTSVTLLEKARNFEAIENETFEIPWIWSFDASFVLKIDDTKNAKLTSWIRQGGFLIIENINSEEELHRFTQRSLGHGTSQKGWQVIPPDHELMRSYHLLDALPICPNMLWRGFHYDGRLAILAIPYSLIEAIRDNNRKMKCLGKNGHETAVRIFINILMVVLTTDYKKDQIHLPEILKRLR